MATYHIAPDGSDGGDGSSGSPWFSITHAAGRVSPGDTIVVQDGTYDYGSSVQRISGVSGRSGDPITLAAADGASPTLVWSGGASGWRTPTTEGILVDGSDHWVIEGLELRDSEAWGLHITDADAVTVRNVESHDNAGPGIGVAYAGRNHRFIGCDVHHNGVQGSTTDDGDGIIVNGASGDVSGTVIEGCRVWANTDDGIDLWDGSGITIRNCTSWDNGRTGSTTDGSGMGFKLGGGSDGGNNHIEHCAAWNNEYAGIADNISPGATVWNCTCWNNSRNYEMSGGDDELVNCISHEGPINLASGTDQRSNSWNQGIDDPQFASLDPSAGDFLRLADGSPCIDAGVDVGLSYEGDAPDLGAYESGAETDSGSDSSSESALYYHDGTDWIEVSMRYHDGEQFV